MAKKGYKSFVIEKVMSGNYVRFASEIWQHESEAPRSAKDASSPSAEAGGAAALDWRQSLAGLDHQER